MAECLLITFSFAVLEKQTPIVIIFILLVLILVPYGSLAADRLIGIHSARVLSQSMPWIAQEAGLFKKYNLDFQLVFIASSPAVTAAMLGGDAEIALTGGEGNIRAYVQGATDFVFIGAVKNILTHSILAGLNIKRPEDLKGKKIGINRIGSNPITSLFKPLGKRDWIQPRMFSSFSQADRPRLSRRSFQAAWMQPP